MELTNKRVIVTGATSGIGRELARVFVSRGAAVGIAVRDTNRGAALAQELGAGCDVLAGDFASMTSVHALADGLIQSGRKVDVLMLNAGVYGKPFQLTSEGFEATFASNYLGHFLLVHRLGAANAFAPHARIVITQTSAVTSNPFAKAHLEMLTAPTPKGFSSTQASPSSKILLAYMAHTLARRAANLFTIVSVSPGGVRTGNVDQTPAMFRWLVRALTLPVEQGVEPLVWAATADRLVSGTVYGRDHQPVKLNKVASDLELAARAWSESERILKLAPWPV
jgi:NAD(P)-dependent dehydrogenase (short-subunit alcohol dehydrogenase family)